MIPVGSAGDVHPHVGIGLALQRRGHDVSVLTSAYFEPLLARVGLPLIPVGTVDDYRRTLEHPDLWRPHRALGVIGEAIRPHVTEIARLPACGTRSTPRFGSLLPRAAALVHHGGIGTWRRRCGPAARSS